MDDLLNTLLAGTVDDLADMPTFKNFPNGAHKVKFNWEQKKVNEKPSIEFKFVYIEPIELADPATEAPKAGDEASILLMFTNNDGTKNEFSEGTLKLAANALKERFPGSNLLQILEEAGYGDIRKHLTTARALAFGRHRPHGLRFAHTHDSGWG